MKNLRPTILTTRVGLRQAATDLTAAYVAAAATAIMMTTALLEATRPQDHRRDRGAVSLEQAIITAVLGGAAIALGIVIVNAITSHSANIR